MSDTQSSGQTQRSSSSRPEQSPGLIASTMSVITGAVGFLVMGLFVAIVIEWIGMMFWWPEQGADHSRAMMAREIEFLSEDFRESLFASSPAEFAAHFVGVAEHWLFEKTHVYDVIEWISSAPASNSQFHSQVHRAYLVVAPFVQSAVLMVQTYLLRISVLILAVPVFALFGAVGFADGLMRRDLRRWGGGRESSVAHGTSRSLVVPLLTGPWIVYLSLPITVHPNFIILPAATALGIAVCVTSATFKKYL